MPKNIIIFSDGTGQEGGEEHNTNVYKLYNMIEDRTPHQMAFYDRGVGTGMAKLTGLAGGRGFARNVHDCYQFIFDHFQSGDRLFLIGFSRGAATVRSLSYFIHLFGILPRARPELISEAWKIYKTYSDDRRERKAQAFVRKHHTMWAKVHFLGCYDTVAALGLPSNKLSAFIDGLPGFRHRFHNFHLSPSVVHAYHALAIDDERKTFHPLLWEPLEKSRRELEEKRRKEWEAGREGPASRYEMACKEMKQVWFAGMHTDVGGGYPEQQLSDIALVWLTQQAVGCGLRIYDRHFVQIEEDADGHMHDSRGTRWTRFYRRKMRAWNAERGEKPVLHESVLQRKKGRTNEDEPSYTPWILEVDHDVEPWVRYDEQPWNPAHRPAGGDGSPAVAVGPQE